jgi:hypothetical protein
MKRQLAFLFVLTIFTGLTAYAMEPLQANVPFAFMANNHLFPAGVYRIESAGTSGAIVRINAIESNDGIYSITSRIDRLNEYEVISTWHSGPPTANDKLVKNGEENKSPEVCLIFHKYGNQYFLSKVWNGEEGREFVRSSAEQESMAANAQFEPETVFLAAANR